MSKKNFLDPQLEILNLEDVDVISTSDPYTDENELPRV